MGTQIQLENIYGAAPIETDVVSIGAGLSGTLAAILLSRNNIRVAVVDPHEVYPPDFRAEQLVGDQVEALSRLDLLQYVTGNSTPAMRAVAMRAGRTIGAVTAPHYGIHYDDMVNRARRHLPSSVEFIKARAVDIHTSAERQLIKLSNGSLFEARLVLVATGLGRRLLTRLGIGRHTIREAHSLSFGFDLMVGSPGILADTVFVAYGERQRDAIDYITIFRIEDTVRANLFTYGGRRSPLTQNLLRNPVEALREAMPSVEQQFGGLSAAGAVKFHIDDLNVATNYRQNGVVLIGDAFQTPSPAAGTGVGRLLNDIDRLCNHHIPAWFATGGMNAAKIGTFYDDPAKQSCDAEALRQAEYRRSLTTETSVSWRFHRQRVALQNRLRRLVSRTQPDMSAGAAMAPSPMGQWSKT